MTYSDDEVHEQLTSAAAAVQSAFSALPIPHEVPEPRRLLAPARLPQVNLAVAALAILVAGLAALMVLAPDRESTEVVATRYIETEATEPEPTATAGSGPVGDGTSLGTALAVDTPVAETAGETPTAVAATQTPEAVATEPPSQSPAPAPAAPAPELPAPVTPDETPTPAPEAPTPETATATSMPAPTSTAVPLPTSTPVPAPMPTPVPVPTPIPAPTPTPVPAPTPTPVPAPTSAPLPSPTVVPELDICYGEIDPVIQIAKANYTAACGITYSDTSGVHQCVWIGDEGWRCHGPRAEGHESAQVADSALSTIATPAPSPTVVPELDICYGEIDPVIQIAKANYTAACGITYSDTSGVHQCVWIDDEGWRCHGPRAEGARSE